MGGRDGPTLKDFWIWELDEGKRVKMFLRAEEGEMNYNEGNKELILTLKEGTAEQRDPKDPESFSDNVSDSLFFGEFPIALELEQLFGGERLQSTRIKEMTFAQLMDRRSEELAREKSKNEPISKERLDLQVHVQKNFALAFSVFSLAVFGVPLAIQAGRKETYANLGIALIIAISYYFLTIMFSWLEGSPSLRPDLLIWVPNLIFQATGFWMLHRFSRY
jgi:lipopolysaccharide export system permease protein